MKTFGLVGKHIQHSFSPTYFANKFKKEGIKNCRYQLFPLSTIEEIQPLLLEEKTLIGLNVTIPYKQVVLPFLQALSPQAKEIGAVNTIKIEQGKLTGYNTDVYGFQTALEEVIRPLQRQSKALVLGTGGASKAVVYALEQLGIPYQYVSRNKGKNLITYDELNTALVQQHLLIINTTPLGMSPQIDQYPPLPYAAIGEQHLLFDLVYNPLQTTFMKKGLANGATVTNGLKMLHLQAEKAWEIWMK